MPIAEHLKRRREPPAAPDAKPSSPSATKVSAPSERLFRAAFTTREGWQLLDIRDRGAIETAALKAPTAAGTTKTPSSEAGRKVTTTC